LCSKTWSRSDSPVSSFHANSRRQSGDRVRSRRSEKNTSVLRRAAARMDLLKNLDLTPSSFPAALRYVSANGRDRSRGGIGIAITGATSSVSSLNYGTGQRPSLQQPIPPGALPPDSTGSLALPERGTPAMPPSLGRWRLSLAESDCKATFDRAAPQPVFQGRAPRQDPRPNRRSPVSSPAPSPAAAHPSFARRAPFVPRSRSSAVPPCKQPHRKSRPSPATAPRRQKPPVTPS